MEQKYLVRQGHQRLPQLVKETDVQMLTGGAQIGTEVPGEAGASATAGSRLASSSDLPARAATPAFGFEAPGAAGLDALPALLGASGGLPLLVPCTHKT